MNPSKSHDLYSNIVGQSIAISLLKSAVLKQKIAPAYLFSGPHGVGRKITALRFLESIITNGTYSFNERRKLENSNHPDLMLVEPTYLHQGSLISQSNAKNESVNKKAQAQIRLDQIRLVKDFLGKKPIESYLGMVVIEDVERMNEAASNALLKVLEEPQNGILILITSRPEMLLNTIKSRCQKIPFTRLTEDAFQKVISRLKPTNMKTLTDIDQKALTNLSHGSPGLFIDNLQIWDDLPKNICNQLYALPKQPIDSLSLAKDLTENLDSAQQIWVINWLQENLWAQKQDKRDIQRLELLKKHLLSYVQNRLAWEVTLLELSQNN